MDMAERLPSLTSEDLASLRSNAERLGLTGTPRQQEEADRLLPLIDAEVKGRKASRSASLESLRRRKKA
jgi:superfamily II DNA or RNA helicase